MNEATKTTLHHISESHEELMTRQMALKSAQANVHSQIVSNIRDLVREKAVIAAGNRELMEVAEQIQEKLGAFVCTQDNEAFPYLSKKKKKKKQQKNLTFSLSIGIDFDMRFFRPHRWLSR